MDRDVEALYRRFQVAEQRLAALGKILKCKPDQILPRLQKLRALVESWTD